MLTVSVLRRATSSGRAPTMRAIPSPTAVEGEPWPRRVEPAVHPELRPGRELAPRWPGGRARLETERLAGEVEGRGPVGPGGSRKRSRKELSGSAASRSSASASGRRPASVSAFGSVAGLRCWSRAHARVASADADPPHLPVVPRAERDRPDHHAPAGGLLRRDAVDLGAVGNHAGRALRARHRSTGIGAHHSRRAWRRLRPPSPARPMARQPARNAPTRSASTRSGSRPGTFTMGTDAEAIAALTAANPPPWVASEFAERAAGARGHAHRRATGSTATRSPTQAFAAFVEAGGYTNQALWSRRRLGVAERAATPPACRSIARATSRSSRGCA